MFLLQSSICCFAGDLLSNLHKASKEIIDQACQSIMVPALFHKNRLSN